MQRCKRKGKGLYNQEKGKGLYNKENKSQRCKRKVEA